MFAGAEEAIFCLMNVMAGPGDHVVVTWPGYQSLFEVARAAGADVTLHELHETDGWALDVDRLLASLTPATRLVVVNAPHNPTGMLPTTGEWAALTGALEARGIHLLADEVYRWLEFDDADRLRAGAEAYERGISLGVMSKSFAMAGLRIGWLATRDRELLARCAAMKDYTTICSSAPSEILALIGLRARDRILARSRGIVETGPGPAGRLLRGLGGPVRMGPSARRLRRLPPTDRARPPDRRLGGGAGRGRGGPAAAGIAVRPPGQPFPHRVRADGPAGGARGSRALRGRHAPVACRGAAAGALVMPMQGVTDGLLPADGARQATVRASHHERSPRMATTTTRRPSANGRRSPDPKLDARAGEIQRYGTLRKLPIGLPDKARATSCELLNEILADSMVLTSLYKKHHWLVAGPTFYQLHLLFDKHYEEQAELVDLLAERVQSLGGIAVGDPRHAAELTTIPRPPDGAEEVAGMIDRTLQAHETSSRRSARRSRRPRRPRTGAPTTC